MLASIALSLFALLAAAHKHPTTENEIHVQRSLQAAAYYCAPSVAEFTATRKREFTQKVMTGRPQLPGYDDLFASYDSSVKHPSGQTLMSCGPVEREPEINNTCVLTPITTEGPYYHKEGHPIRQNIAEYQDGLMLLLDIGVIDVNTCKPLPNVLVDIWHANATGDYAGHPEPYPGLENEQPAADGPRKGLRTDFPRKKYEETWLRGAWPTNSRGVAQFVTIYPGYYTGRATHVHTKVFTEWEVLSNGSFRSDKLVHTGQFFFDDQINEVVEKMHPYSTNPIRDTYRRTRNHEDGLNIFHDSFSPEGQYSPIMRVEFLGGVIAQGLIGYITMGINASAIIEGDWKNGELKGV